MRRIENAFAVKMDTLMRMQSAYDITQTRKRDKIICVRRIHLPTEVYPWRFTGHRALSV